MKNISKYNLNLVKVGHSDELPTGTANFLNNVLGNIHQNTLKRKNTLKLENELK